MGMSSLLLSPLFLSLHLLFTLTSSQPTPFHLLLPLLTALPSSPQPIPSLSLLSPDHPFSVSKPSPQIITKPDSFLSGEGSTQWLRHYWKQAPTVTQTLPYHMTQDSSDVTYLCADIKCKDKTEEIDTTGGRDEKSQVFPVIILIIMVVIFKLACFFSLCKKRLRHFQKRQQRQSAEALKRIQQSQNDLMQAYSKADLARVSSNAAMKSKVHIVVTMSLESLTLGTDPAADTWSAPALPPCIQPLLQHSPTTSNQSLPSMMQDYCAAPAPLSVNRAELWCSLDGLLRIYHTVDHGMEEGEEEEEEDSDEGYEDDKHSTGGEPVSKMWDFYCMTNEFTQEESGYTRLALSREAGTDTASRTRGGKAQGCHGGPHSSRSTHEHDRSHSHHTIDSSIRWASIDMDVINV